MSQNKKIKLMYEGFFETCNRVGKSMGAEGALGIIALNNEFSAPYPTKDGVTICRNTFFKNKHKNVGAYFAKQATAKTLTKVGDATSTNLVFAKAIVENTLKKSLFKSEYFYNSKVRDGIEAAAKEVSEYMEQVSKEATQDKIYAVAHISANNDKIIADLVVKAYEAVGRDGVVNVEQDYDSSLSSLKVSEGMQLSKGMRSPFLCNQETGVYERENVNILVYEGNIMTHNAQQVADFIQDKASEPIVIICEHISDDVMLNVVDNFQRGKLDICVVEAPFFADQRKAILQDIAVYVDADVFVQGTSDKMKFGKADKIIIDMENTSIVQNQLNENTVKRIEHLKTQTSGDKEFNQKRVSALEGKAAIIKVGGTTEGARKEIFDRVEDSVAAVKSAVQKGVVSGGGSALVYISSQMQTTFDNKDVQFGYNVVKKALLAPYKTILQNAKVDYKKFIDASQVYGQGYNVKKHVVEDLEKSGVVDSVKSIEVALENAISVAVLLLNTKVVVTN